MKTVTFQNLVYICYCICVDRYFFKLWNEHYFKMLSTYVWNSKNEITRSIKQSEVVNLKVSLWIPPSGSKTYKTQMMLVHVSPCSKQSPGSETRVQRNDPCFHKKLSLSPLVTNLMSLYVRKILNIGFLYLAQLFISINTHM